MTIDEHSHRECGSIRPPVDDRKAARTPTLTVASVEFPAASAFLSCPRNHYSLRAIIELTPGFWLTCDFAPKSRSGGPELVLPHVGVAMSQENQRALMGAVLAAWRIEQRVSAMAGLGDGR